MIPSKRNKLWVVLAVFVFALCIPWPIPGAKDFAERKFQRAGLGTLKVESVSWSGLLKPGFRFSDPKAYNNGVLVSAKDLWLGPKLLSFFQQRREIQFSLSAVGISGIKIGQLPLPLVSLGDIEGSVAPGVSPIPALAVSFGGEQSDFSGNLLSSKDEVSRENKIELIFRESPNMIRDRSLMATLLMFDAYRDTSGDYRMLWRVPPNSGMRSLGSLLPRRF